MSQNKILKNAYIVMIYSLLAKFASFFVELLIASDMGVSKETDAFYMVYGIVQIIYPMISVGIWKVFMPEYKARIVLGKKEEASEITNQLFIFFSMVSAIIIGVALAFPKGLIFLFASGFDEESFGISENLLRIVIFIIFFNTFTTFSSAILQSWNKFGKAQLKEIVFHAPTLLYLIIFRSGCTIYGLAYSILAGAVCTAVMTYIFARSSHTYHLPKTLFTRNLLGVIKQVPVACLTSVINQLNNVIDKNFASSLPAGSVTYLNYGSKLIHLFDGLFSTALSTALFPYMTELVAKEEFDRLRQFLKNYIVLISAVILPISTIILIYSEEIVQIVFERGKFDRAATKETAVVLLMYGLGLLVMCLTTIVNDIFYILKRTNILLWTTVANIVFNIILDFSLVNKWGVAGLSLATTISLFIALIIKFVCIRDIFKFDFELVRYVILLVVYCGVASLIPYLLLSRLEIHAILKLLVGGASFCAVYFLCILTIDKGMKSRLLSSLKRLTKKKEE